MGNLKIQDKTYENITTIEIEHNTIHLCGPNIDETIPLRRTPNDDIHLKCEDVNVNYLNL